MKAKAKQKRFENLFKDASDTADTWKCINQLLRKTKPKTTLPKTIETDGKLITSPQNICNEINKHFVKIGENLATNSRNSSFHQSKQHFTFLGKRIVSSIVLQLVLEFSRPVSGLETVSRHIFESLVSVSPRT